PSALTALFSQDCAMAVPIRQEVIRATRITRVIAASGLLVNYFFNLTSARVFDLGQIQDRCARTIVDTGAAFCDSGSWFLGPRRRNPNMRTIIIRILALALFSTLPYAALAQTPPAQPTSASSQQLLTDQQLDALLAPIALYPDVLLSEILMASTYPLEVVE